MPDGGYVVECDRERPSFLADSVGGPYKGVPLTVDVEALKVAWTGSAVLYIGKANGVGGLRGRAWAYARQGRAGSAGHSGGRYLWQHPASPELRVGWRTTGDLDAEGVEDSLLGLFIEEFGHRLFANLKDGRRKDCKRVEPPEAREYLQDWLKEKRAA